MYTANNQVIFEEIYDENIQPTEDEIIEYANFLGIDLRDEFELMWIARQGVMAPLPRGWKPVQDPQGELYYFNFETGESIWDHPCDQDFKKLVLEERKILQEKGKEIYLANLSESRVQSPVKSRNQLRNSDKLNGISSLKSTSTISDVLNGKQQQNNLRSGFSMLDTKDLANVEYEEEEENEQVFKDEDDEKNEDEESEPSWKQKKSDSEESSDGFHKPVDFGIDRDTSMKLDKLNVMLMVSKEKELNKSNQNRLSLDSMATTSIDIGGGTGGLDSPTRAYIKQTTGFRDNDDNDVKRSASFLGESIDTSIRPTKTEPDHRKDLKLLQDSLEREFDQKRLELLENKDSKIRKLKDDIELELKRMNENERKRLLKDQEDKLKDLKENLENDLEKEREQIRKKHAEQLHIIQKEFENEKQLRKEKFSMQISKFMKSGKSFDELDENEEKRELSVYFEHIEKKYAEKLDERKKELQLRYEKKTKETEDDLQRIYEQEAETKTNEIRLLKEKNLKVENFEKQMKDLLDEKLKEFKKKEALEMDTIKKDYDIKIKTFRDKYKELEEKEFKYFENEFNNAKEKLQIDYNSKVKNAEDNLKINFDRLKREEEDLKKRLELINERRKELDKDWVDLEEKTNLLEEKKEAIRNKSTVSNNNNNNNTNSNNDQLIQIKYELERLKLENSELVAKLNASQKILDKFYKSKNIHLKKAANNEHLVREEEADEEENDDNDDDDESISENKKNINMYKNDYLDEDDEDDNDDNEMKELMKHAKQKLKLKLYNAKKNAGFQTNNDSKSNSSNSAAISINNNNNNNNQQLVISTSSDNSSTNSSNSSQNSDNESLNKNKKSEFLIYKNRPVTNIDLSKHKLYLIENINKEKDTLNVANELLNKFRQSLAKRKLHLETARQELKTDEKYVTIKSSTLDRNKIESKKIEIDREEIDLKQLLLNIKSSKRVLKQKKNQLSMLENNVTNTIENGKFNIKEASFSSDISSDMSLTNNENLATTTTTNNNANYYYSLALNDLSKIGDDSNLNELIVKLNKLKNTNGELNDSTIRYLEPILQSLPKLNLKLKETLQNLTKYHNSSKIVNSTLNNTTSYDLNQATDLEAASALNFINEKWQKYLNSSTDLNNEAATTSFNISQLFNKVNTNTNVNNNKHKKDKKASNTGAWENLPAYHKLTFEAGAKMLDDKWRKYIGDASSTITNSRFLTPKKKNSKLSSSLMFNSSNELTATPVAAVMANPLPVATQQRLNQHREWLKRFKAETTNFKF